MAIDRIPRRAAPPRSGLLPGHLFHKWLGAGSSATPTMGFLRQYNVGGNIQDELLKDISGKLDIIMKLLAKQSVLGKSIAEAAVFLNQLGLSNKDVATLLDTTSNVIGVRLSEAKKKRTK